MSSYTDNGRTATERVGAMKDKVGTRVGAYFEAKGPRDARPLFGVLPIKRVVPMDVHSIVDYAAAGAAVTSGMISDGIMAKTTGIAVGASYGAVSALTDYRLSVAKLIPIEVHEVLDHLVGLAQIAAPFVLGYWKKDRVASIVQIANGATTVLISLFTDYRAARGVGGDAEAMLAE